MSSAYLRLLIFFPQSFFLVLSVYCYQPISVHPHAWVLSYVIPWTAACQAPLSMDFSRQEYWSGLSFPSPVPCNLDSSLSFIQPSILHNVLCIKVKEAGWQYTALMYSFPNLEPVHCSMSSSNCCFLTHIRVSQEEGKVVSYSHLFKKFSTVCCDPHSQRL